MRGYGGSVFFAVICGISMLAGQYWAASYCALMSIRYAIEEGIRSAKK